MADEPIVTDNVTDNITGNVTGREAASSEGLVTAYTFLFVMALVPIFIGSIRSVVHHDKLRVSATRGHIYVCVCVEKRRAS